jgi:hypothetical protein
MVESKTQEFVVAFVANLEPRRIDLFCSRVISLSRADALRAKPYSTKFALSWYILFAPILLFAIETALDFARQGLIIGQIEKNGYVNGKVRSL